MARYIPPKADPTERVRTRRFTVRPRHNYGLAKLQEQMGFKNDSEAIHWLIDTYTQAGLFSTLPIEQKQAFIRGLVTKSGITRARKERMLKRDLNEENGK